MAQTMAYPRPRRPELKKSAVYLCEATDRALRQENRMGKKTNVVFAKAEKSPIIKKSLHPFDPSSTETMLLRTSSAPSWLNCSFSTGL